jgi:uncharacterized membrane protein
MLPWYVFAILSAVFVALSQIARKKVLYNEHALEFSVMRSLVIMLIALFLLPWVNFSLLTVEIMLLFFLVGFIAAFATILLSKAMRHMEISTVGPLTNISPIFLLILTYFFLGEKINIQQFGGIALVILGGYILNLDHKLSDLKRPIVKFFKSKHYHFLLIALILYSITAFLDKIVIDLMVDTGFGSSTVYTATFFIWLFMGITLMIILYWKYDFIQGLRHGVKVGGVLTFLSGLFSVISSLFYFQAISMNYVSLVIPIKRFSTLLTTLIGGELFHDHNLLMKIVACIIMVVGATLVAL